MHHCSKGFSFIEVLITLSIIAILTGVGTVTFPTLLEKHRLSLAGEELIGQFRLARTRAILENRTYQLKISNHRLETRINSVLIHSYSLPEEFTYQLVGSVYFYGKGMASPKTIIIYSSSYTYTIIISINGRIRTEIS